MSFVITLLIQLNYAVKRSNPLKITFCDTCAQSSRRYEICVIFLHTVVISRKTVKSTRNTNSDACTQNSPGLEFCDIFAQTVVISCKTVKSAKSTFCDTCAQNWQRFQFCDISISYCCNKP